MACFHAYDFRVTILFEISNVFFVFTGAAAEACGFWDLQGAASCLCLVVQVCYTDVNMCMHDDFLRNHSHKWKMSAHVNKHAKT